MKRFVIENHRYASSAGDGLFRIDLGPGIAYNVITPVQHTGYLVYARIEENTPDPYNPNSIFNDLRLNGMSLEDLSNSYATRLMGSVQFFAKKPSDGSVYHGDLEVLIVRWLD